MRVPLPEPELPEVIVIQLVLLAVFQLHPVDVDTLTVPKPPMAVKPWLVGEREYVQLGVPPCWVTLKV